MFRNARSRPGLLEEADQCRVVVKADGLAPERVWQYVARRSGVKQLTI